MQTLMLAAKNGDLETVKYCIDNRHYVFSWNNCIPSYQKVTTADFINKLSDDHNYTPPFRLACEFGHTEIVSFLIANGADVNQQDHNGTTALEIAIFMNNAEIEHLLRINGANIENRNSENTADEWAWPERGADECLAIGESPNTDEND